MAAIINKMTEQLFAGGKVPALKAARMVQRIAENKKEEEEELRARALSERTPIKPLTFGA